MRWGITNVRWGLRIKLPDHTKLTINVGAPINPAVSETVLVVGGYGTVVSVRPTRVSKPTIAELQTLRS